MKRTVTHFIASLVWVALMSAAWAQPLSFSTLAGYAGQGKSDGSGATARFNHPHGMAIDAAGTIFVADTDNQTIRKISNSGSVTTLAGIAGVAGNDDGTLATAHFNRPQGVAVDSANNVYVADTGNHTIRMISSAGSVTTLAGSAGIAGNANGSGTNASFNQPLDVTVDGSGNLYVADFGNGAIRKVTPSGVVTTLANVPGPQGLSISGSTIYVADYSSSTIYKVTTSGVVTTLAGAVNTYGNADGIATNALFYFPSAVAADMSGNCWVADYYNSTIRYISSGGVVTTVAGRPGITGFRNAIGANALFNGPQGIAVDAQSNVYVSDTANGIIRRIDANGVVTTFAGSPSTGTSDGVRGSARFASPVSLAADLSGNLYIADTQNNSIRKITADGNVTTFAGNPNFSGSANGSGANALFNSPQSVAVDSSGNLYVADTGNNMIRKITTSGDVSTFVGSTNDGSADGIGTSAQFNRPQALTVDPGGNVLVADTLNHTIRRITSGGTVSTIAGLAETPGCADGTNNNARFNWPAGITTDSNGNIYVSDLYNHSVRKISSNGTNWIVSTIAGSAGVAGALDGTNTSARFFAPRGIVVDASGNLYVADSGNHCIRMVTPSGTNWIVTTIAGSGIDGISEFAQFNNPSGIAIDGAGYLYVADTGNNTLRVDRYVPPSLQFSFSANQAIFSWPGLTPGFVLESSPSLAPNSVWTPIAVGVLVGDSYVLTNHPDAGDLFYRLRQQ